MAIEASGAPDAVEEAPALIRDGGRDVIAGHYTDAGTSAINAHQHINKKHFETPRSPMRPRTAFRRPWSPRNAARSVAPHR